MPISKLVIVPPHGVAFKNEQGSTATVHFDPDQCHPIALYEALVKSIEGEVVKFCRANPKYMPAQGAAPVAMQASDPLDLTSRRIDPDERHLREARGPKDCLKTGQHDAASMRRIPRSEDGICNDCGTQVAGYYQPLAPVPNPVSPMTNPFAPHAQSLGQLAVSEEVINAQAAPPPVQHQHARTEPAPPPPMPQASVSPAIPTNGSYKAGDHVAVFSGGNGRIVRQNRFSDGLEGEWYLVQYAEVQRGRKADWIPVEEIQLQPQGV